MTTLDCLSAGESGVIAALSGDDPVTVRFLEMGLLPGERIAVLGAAPLGDPIAVLVRGSRLAIRRRDAARVQLADVQLTPPPAPLAAGGGP